MNAWQNYDLFVTMGGGDTPRSAHSLITHEGERRMHELEKGIRSFYYENRSLISGAYLTHYAERLSAERAADVNASLSPDSSRADSGATFRAVREGELVEFIRLRFRVPEERQREIRSTLKATTLEPLMSRDGPLLAWAVHEGYTARGDVGSRFGDLQHGVDPTEPVVAILTACTELRFYLLDHPDFEPNHDIIHLYFNIMGVTYPGELEALEDRGRRVRQYMSSWSG